MNRIESEARDLFISMRTREEEKVKLFGEAINKLDRKEVFGDLEIPDVISLQAVCPELYNTDPNPEVYKQQFEEWSKVVTEMNKCIEAYNKEGLECLLKAKELMSTNS